MFKPMAVSSVNVSIFKRETQQQAAILYLPEFLLLGPAFSPPPDELVTWPKHNTFQAAISLLHSRF